MEMGSVWPGPLDPDYRDVRRYRENNAKLDLTVRDDPAPLPAIWVTTPENIHDTTSNGKERYWKEPTFVDTEKLPTPAWYSVPAFHQVPKS